MNKQVNAVSRTQQAVLFYTLRETMVLQAIKVEHFGVY